MSDFANIIGLIGVALIMVTYFLLQVEKISARGLGYSILNLVGAVLIMVSLFYYWNLSAFIIEICWILISFYGIIRYFTRRHSSKIRPQ